MNPQIVAAASPRRAVEPAPEVPAQTTTRNFVDETTIMQRERDPNAPRWLFTAGALAVLLRTLMVIAGIAWGAGRINATETEPTQP